MLEFRGKAILGCRRKIGRLKETSETLDTMTSTESGSWQSASPSLIGRAVAGDATAWQRLIQIYGPLVYAWGRRHGLPPHDAADVTQETFWAVATSIARFDGTRPGATFRGWLWTITRNKAADLARGAQDPCDGRGGSTNMERIQAVADDAWASSSYEASTPAADAAADRKAVVRRAIALIRSSFEPTTWQAFWRTVIDGQSPDEVAEELSLSRWAVYKARSRVLHRLRTELQGLEQLD